MRYLITAILLPLMNTRSFWRCVFDSVLLGTLSVFATTQVYAAAAASLSPVQVSWLGGKEPGLATGTSWGVPWPRGAVTKDQAFSLHTATGTELPLQSWPL